MPRTKIHPAAEAAPIKKKTDSMGEIHRRIDSARDVLVGKVPDPKSQVEQITLALIYKFMGDMDDEAVAMGGKPTFFSDKNADLAWKNLFDPRLGGADMLKLYEKAIESFSLNDKFPELFRNIFKNAYLPYRDPETLKLFLKTINGFQYDHSERLGDAFEYLLSVLGSQGDAGQFRTPRHIIDFIVKVVDPGKDDKILDPACGTAGFLISAFKHVINPHTFEHASKSGDVRKVLRLTTQERAQLMHNIRGYDISPDMVRLSLVNLYLHGFASPEILEYDTLTSDERWNEYYDVILANPPFMSPKGGIKPHKRFSIDSKRSEVLFLDYILDHLTPQGCAGIIVPEGIHFVGQAAMTQLRRKLIEGGFLIADITLPHGVFKPYASVKTHILVIDRTLGSKSDQILFLEIENDGYTQGDAREPIPGSQLDAALEQVSTFKKSISEKHAWKKPNNALRTYAFTKEMLLSNANAHLLGRWHDLPNRVIHRGDTPLKSLGELCEIRDGKSPNMATLPGEYTMVVPAEERKTADHWDLEGKAVCIPLVSSAGHGKADIKRLHYQEGKFALANTMCALFAKDENVIRPRFLHIFLSAMCQDLLVPLMCGATNVTMDSDQLADVLIPVPDVKLQDEVIESDLISEKAGTILAAASNLKESSSDMQAVKLAENVMRDTEAFLKTAKKRLSISEYLPNQ